MTCSGELMSATRRNPNPIAEADTDDLFEHYLRRTASDARLADWVIEHIEDSGVKLTDAARSVFVEALGCLTKEELIAQVMRNQTDRRAARDYHTWCLEEAEALAARKARRHGLW